MIIEALGKGELDKAYELTTPEIAEKLSIAGTPEECVANIKEIRVGRGQPHDPLHHRSRRF